MQTDMNKKYGWLGLMLPAMLLVSCTGARHLRRDLIFDPFPEAQAELREVLKRIINDAENANVTSLRATHLEPDKFTKFAAHGIERLNVDQCNESEAANVTSKQDYEYEVRDLKIDVFGEVAIVTCYPQVSCTKDGEVIQYSSRQTLVFLETADGWKIIHEHGTPKAWYEQ